MSEMAILHQLRTCLTGALLLDACECCSNHNSVAGAYLGGQEKQNPCTDQHGPASQKRGFDRAWFAMLRMTIRSMHLCARGGLQPSAPPSTSLVDVYLKEISLFR